MGSRSVQIQTGSGQAQGQVQYKAGQVEPTRDMLELDLSKDIGHEHVQIRNATKYTEANARGRHCIARRSGGTDIKHGQHPQSPHEA